MFWRYAIKHQHVNLCQLKYHDQKIWQTLTHNIWTNWTAVLILLGIISNVYHDLPHWRSNQQPQNEELKPYHWATDSHHTQVMPNQQVMSTPQSINLNGGDHSIHSWWDLIRLKQLSSGSICRVQVFVGFSGHGNSIYNIIPPLKKKKCTCQFVNQILL